MSLAVFDPKLTTLPNWFKLDDFMPFYKNTYNNVEELTVYIGDMPNLDPKEVINLLKNFNLIKGIVIVDCPKFKDFEGLPKKIGQDGLVFKPSPNAKFRYRDILKYFTQIEGPIIFNRIDDNNEEKLLKKAAAKAANDAKIDISIQQAPPVNEVTKENNLQDKIAKSRGSIYSNCQSYVASQSATSFFSHYSESSSL